MSNAVTSPLAEVLDGMTAEAALCERLAGRKVRCVACGHRCVVFEGQRGICRVRFNRGGVLRAPRGYVAGLQCDPIEKKPFFHVLPGSPALTFGMLGCDLHCGYCQNWLTSQALRDPVAGVEPVEISPDNIVRIAERYGAKMVVSSYNEPLITAEWAIEVFKLAKAKGLRTGFVSNGNATPEALSYVRPWTDCYKVDLKSMSERSYRSLGCKLGNVLDTIRTAKGMGFWLEVVTLVVPGFNDSDVELRECAGFLASVSKDIPWHVTAFHKDYRMRGPEDTVPATLLRSVRIGKEAGLRYVYSGNLPGMVGRSENTCCPGCGARLVERTGFQVQRNRLRRSGQCPDCSTVIPGIWE